MGCTTAADRDSTTPLGLYLRDVRAGSLLSRDQECALAEAIGRGEPDARNELVRSNLRLVIRIARDKLGLSVYIEPKADLPAPRPEPLFSILDRILADQLTQQIGRPFWIDTYGNGSLVEIRVQLEDKTLRVFTSRSAAYASNTHIFLVWMVGASLVLIAISILFLRGQIKPIEALAKAAENFGKGQKITKPAVMSVISTQPGTSPRSSRNRRANRSGMSNPRLARISCIPLVGASRGASPSSCGHQNPACSTRYPGNSAKATVTGRIRKISGTNMAISLRPASSMIVRFASSRASPACARSTDASGAPRSSAPSTWSSARESAG